MKIHIENLEFKCIIGLLEKERVSLQRVIIDITLEAAGKKMVLDYAKVAKLTEKTFKKKKFYTVEESLVVMEKIFKKKFPQIVFFHMKVLKPDILLNCEVGVSHSRKY